MKGLFLMCALALLSGCGVNTKQVRLELPEATRVTPATAKQIVLASVTDQRDLLNSPSSFGNTITSALLKNLGPADAKSLIAGGGRGSNGYAVILADGESVSDVMRKLISNILEQHGYVVLRDSMTHPGIPAIDVRINQFFLNEPFNFGRVLTWTSQMKADISTDVTIKENGSSHEFSIEGSGANIVQTNRGINYVETYTAAMKDYTKSFDAKVFNKL